MLRIGSCLALLLLLGSQSPRRADIVVADFEGRDYGKWQTTGTAFGTGPASGAVSGQMRVSGFLGHGLVNSYHGGDDATGTLTSPPFQITRKHINFLIGGGQHPGLTCINLLVNGAIARTATGPNDRPGGTERLQWHSWDVADLEGSTARIEIVDRAMGGWGHINVDQITLSDEEQKETVQTTPLYGETYRPQFHFTAQRGWLNDPNGMVFYKGEYHLFFQHNPFGLQSGNLTWGHAVSRDLTHWEQIANAITPDVYGPIWSGSAVVDEHNTSGLQSGPEKTLVAFYTAAGGTSPESKGQPFTQRMVYSNDRGRTWTKYEHNPVIPHIIGEDRDPKVVWYAPTRKWIMALFLDRDDYAFFSSPDLTKWTRFQTLTTPGNGECPDFFEMPVQGKPGLHKWVFTTASGRYLVGDFDGAKFTPDAGLQQVDYGANYYAVQTFSDVPASDGRRIQIAWMSGGEYPQMPFNQQMSYPCEMTLHDTPDGLRLYRYPVKEITRLYAKPSGPNQWHNAALNPGDNPLSALKGELWDIEATFEIGNGADFGLRIRGEDVRYHVKEQTLSCLGRTAPLKAAGSRVTLRVLADRTSLEVFGNGGQASLTSCYLPSPQEQSLEAFTEGGTATLVSLVAHKLHSAWPANAKPLP